MAARAALATLADPSQSAASAHIRRETTRFLQLATRSPMNVHVPACPAVTVEAVTAHLGRTLRQYRALLVGDPEQLVRAPRGPAVVEWTGACLEPLLRLLQEPAIAADGVRPRAALSRLCDLLATEVTVHRFDLESVLGEHTATPPDLAVEQIECLFADFVPRLAGSLVAPIGGSVQLRARDVGLAWAVSVSDGRLVTRRLPPGRSHADVVVSARAQDLALLLWKRTPPQQPRIHVSGSATVLRRLLLTEYIADPRTSRRVEQACTAVLLPASRAASQPRRAAR